MAGRYNIPGSCKLCQHDVDVACPETALYVRGSRVLWREYSLGNKGIRFDQDCDGSGSVMVGTKH